jgi:ubiquinone/menaquinone biosynthesis C-methylase UbiE
MTQGMDYNFALTQTLESLYKTKEAAIRRKAVLDGLNLKRGECVLDIGTGPGYVAFEMAEAVGPLGQVECVDVSDAMIDSASRRCLSRPWVCFQIGSATELPFKDSICDAAASVQVYEFVPDIALALKELRRVLRPGGRAAIVSTDWTSLVWRSVNMERMARILEVFKPHCAHFALPPKLPTLLKAEGFTLSYQNVLPHFSASGSEETFSFQLAQFVATFVIDQGIVGKQEAAAWLDDLRQTEAQGDWFFNVNQYLFIAHRPA